MTGGRPGRPAGLAALGVWICLEGAGLLVGQQPGVHFFHPQGMPPGAIGNQQLQRGGPLPGYFQPVKITAPDGVLVSLAEQGRFGQPQQTPVCVGLLIGQVYRLRVMHLPLRPGAEVFPTVEIVDRLYPPMGQELRFPIPIELTQEDLELALEGKFVTRVVYLEDPQKALPVAEPEKAQGWFEVAPGTDPLAVADALGRPVAIVRMGARLPQRGEAPEMAFLYGCPPWVPYAKPAQKPSQPRANRPPQAPKPQSPKAPAA